MTPSDSDEALAIASENCAREPIHIPGSIQPHGFMLVFDEAAGRVLQASENVREWLGLAVEDLLGRHLDELLADVPPLLARLATLADDETNPFHLGDVRFAIGSRAGQPIAMMAHRWDGVLIAEFEPASDVATAYGNFYPLVRSFISRLQESDSIEALCRRAVEEVKRVTGFGRVKAYSFDAEGNGLVLAEEADPGYPRYLGLCFPAADIPQQARALYCANRIRVIEDANYQPSPLRPQANPLSGKPLDLSFSALRSVSPVHLQYMRNMGTLASMSISIVVRGRLWGLISCHDEQPRAVGFQTRTACELLGSVLSLQIETREAHGQTQRLLGLRQHIVSLLSAMADRDSVAAGLLAMPDALLDFARASGAAIISAANCDLVGQTPPRAQVDALVHWLARRGGQEVFHTDNIGRDIDELPELATHVGGVLAVAISKIHSHYLLWFRPEQVRTVEWAGRPEKSIGPGGALNPRHSFERWQETVRGFCAPWDPLEIEGVTELRSAVLGIVLRKAEEMAQLAGELKKSNKELEAFSYSVSHDLRAPLRHIAGYAELLGEFEGGRLSERGLRFLDHIGESARFAGTLVDNLLSFSQMGRAALRFSDVDLQALVEAIRNEMAPDVEGRRIEWRTDGLPVIIADAAFLHLAMRNLLSNAVKYSRDRNPAIIEVSARFEGDEVIVAVSDNGVGFDMDYAGKLFGVFQRLHRMEEFEGTGIGLASVRRIIERHDGRVWAEGRVDEGATFFFSLPLRGQEIPSRNA
ncbi:histidine kinase [Pseudomonas tohonis]|uniref:histidine kinase n=2 Tax=Pseudomonas tohonis TaxID=2725477 RepID=A0A6J4E9N0_9PSED|nr:ATP-binding protein [Pseudomonas tohonis]BCG26663.1 histidine kinase [Pseudomonas tohonis]